MLGLATTHNDSELKAAPLAMVMALNFKQEVLSLRCHQKQQSQKKNAASILVQTAATSATDGTPPSTNKAADWCDTSIQHSTHHSHALRVQAL